jgi:predicted lactoylglutathione lyase
MHGLVREHLLDDYDPRKIRQLHYQTDCGHQNQHRLFPLSVDSVDEVNRILANGLAAGGTEPNEMRDYGFMQQRTLEDFDGHTWEVFYMDMAKYAAA